MPNMVPNRYSAAQAGMALYEQSTRQPVEVRIRSNIWVAGIIVSTLQFFQKFASLGYEVEYRSQTEYRRDAFRQEDIRPVLSNNGPGGHS